MLRIIWSGKVVLLLHDYKKNSNMKKIFVSLFFVGASVVIASAQTGQGPAQSTQSSTSTTQKTTTHKKTTSSTSANGDATATSGKSSTKKHHGWKKGKHLGSTKPVIKHSTKTTTTTTANQ
jgi:hypothetical protein